MRSATTSVSPTRTWTASRQTSECSSLQEHSHTPAELRQELALEPGMPPEPGDIAPSRVRQREIARTALAPGVDAVGHRWARALDQVMVDGVRADQQGELDVRQTRKDEIMPARRAFGARGQVATVRVDARIAEGHAHDRAPALVVEGLAGNAK